MNCHTLPEDRRRSTCVQTNGISASVLASGVFRGATLLIEKRSLCRQIQSGRVCKIRAVVLTCDVGPNITGELGYMRDDVDVYQFASGAFSIASGGIGYTGGNRVAGIKWTFSANRSNSAYAASDTVQPSSLRGLPCIKF